MVLKSIRKTITIESVILLVLFAGPLELSFRKSDAVLIIGWQIFAAV